MGSEKGGGVISEGIGRKGGEGAWNAEAIQPPSADRIGQNAQGVFCIRMAPMNLPTGVSAVAVARRLIKLPSGSYSMLVVVVVTGRMYKLTRRVVFCDGSHDEASYFWLPTCGSS